MQDRFKFRTYIPDLKFFKYWGWIEKGHFVGLCVSGDFSTDELLEKYTNQCTGLRDKNGTLIYEGDIVKYAEFDFTDFSFKDWETEKAQVIYGNDYDAYYPAFDLKDKDFDGTNAFSYLFNEGWTIEVIGNIYENKELLE